MKKNGNTEWSAETDQLANEISEKVKDFVEKSKSNSGLVILAQRHNGQAITMQSFADFDINDMAGAMLQMCCSPTMGKEFRIAMNIAKRAYEIYNKPNSN